MTTFETLRGRLVVSCQAYPGEPLRRPEVMAMMAESVVRGGAAGIRAQGVEDVAAIRGVTGVPVIGLVKREGELITPTVADAVALVEAGADIVAADATGRPRSSGETVADLIEAVHQRGALFMADVATADEGRAAAAAGADVVGTTLSGYTPETSDRQAPDLDLVAELARSVGVPVFAEGRIWTPDQARAALDAGAWAVVVGSAITHPERITERFVAAL